jgi:hypothetical protein
VSVSPASLEGLLVEEGLVSDSAVRQARRVALRRRVTLLEVLVDENTVEEEQVAGALCRRLGLPRLRLGSVRLDEEALREVPHDLASAHLLVPTHLDVGAERRTIQLAMANPLDAGAIEDVAHASGSQLELGVSTLGEIREAIQRCYRGLITKMIPRLHGPGGEPTVPSPGEPTTAPHLQLPDERTPEVRLRALVDLLVEKGLFTQAELEDRVRRLVRGEDV